MKTIAIILGTRPEIIKLAPVIAALRSLSKVSLRLISTGQHDHLARQALEAFDLVPDRSLDLMTDNQSPSLFLAQLLPRLDETFAGCKPDGVLVQGDTTSALGGALAAFHRQIPVAHVEAGLRTNEHYSPFPEEMNRALISRLAALHFCPTPRAVDNLKREGIVDGLYLTGNTVIDAARWIADRLDAGAVAMEERVKQIVGSGRRIVLVTGHRRENFEQPLRNLCEGLRLIVERAEDIEVIFPVHLNPNVQAPVRELLGGVDRVHLLPPIDYPTSIFLIRSAAAIISDSGGIQEEAVAFGTPILVTRRVTERFEAVEAGIAELVDLTKSGDLVTRAIAQLERAPVPRHASTVFGDGSAGARIAEVIAREWLQ